MGKSLLGVPLRFLPQRILASCHWGEFLIPHRGCGVAAAVAPGLEVGRTDSPPEAFPVADW